MIGALIHTNDAVSAPQQSAEVAERSQIQLVPRQDSDHEFLARVFASTRAEEVAQTGWPMQQQQDFLRSQFELQTKAYAMQTPTAEHMVIHFCGEPVGRIIVERTPTEVHLVDISLLPAYRNRKIGSLLMAELLDEAKATNRKCRLYVERFNPAMQWYARMGFRVVDEGSVYMEMHWHPGSPEICEKRA